MMSNHYFQTSDLPDQNRARQQAIPTGHFIGLDLGQAHDPTALSSLWSAAKSPASAWVTFERLVQPRYSSAIWSACPRP